MAEEKKEPSGTTLTEFIEGNHKLISTLAILATLSAFANNLSDKEAGKLLSFLLFALALLICWEILGNVPFVRRGKLYWFDGIFTLTVCVFVYVWSRMYFPYLILALFWAVGLILMTLIFVGCSEAIRKIAQAVPWLKNRSERLRDRLVPGFGAMLVMTLGWLVLRHFKHM